MPDFVFQHNHVFFSSMIHLVKCVFDCVNLHIAEEQLSSPGDPYILIFELEKIPILIPIKLTLARFLYSVVTALEQ